MANQSIGDPLVGKVPEKRRREVQDAFGRHVIEQRNRMAQIVRRRIESDDKHPTPIYERIFERVRSLDSQTRADIASIALLAADDTVSAVLGVFARGDYARFDDLVVNYAVVAQFRRAGSENVIEEVDVNRGEPLIVLWHEYGRWLNRYAPSELRPSSKATGA